MTSEHFRTQIAAWWDWLSDQVGGEGASSVERSFLDDCQNAALHIAELESKLDRIRELLQNCTEADEAWVASGVILTMLEQK